MDVHSRANMPPQGMQSLPQLGGFYLLNRVVDDYHSECCQGNAD